MNTSLELLLPADQAPSAPATAPELRRLPGDLAIWFFILAELLVFGVFFVAYAITRAHHVELFDAEQLTLNRNAGALNTILLLTASYFVAGAVHAARTGLARRTPALLLAGIACGSGFVVVKLFEYADKLGAGITLSSSPFYMFYLSLTFFHFMHVLLGLVILTVLWRQARAGAYNPGNMNGLESGASYWHMVDLLWIVLFPLVYIMR
ncbi:MAG: cytochrome c oxidase subunit 3 family protein [Bacteroidota bacterium]